MTLVATTDWTWLATWVQEVTFHTRHKHFRWGTCNHRTCAVLNYFPLIVTKNQATGIMKDAIDKGGRLASLALAGSCWKRLDFVLVVDRCVAILRDIITDIYHHLCWLLFDTSPAKNTCPFYSFLPTYIQCPWLFCPLFCLFRYDCKKNTEPTQLSKHGFRCFSLIICNQL